jgi:hypothetical protein
MYRHELRLLIDNLILKLPSDIQTILKPRETAPTDIQTPPELP